MPATPSNAVLFNPDSAPARGAGIALVIATAAEILAMAHHPSVETHDIAPAIEQIGRFATLAGVVHGVLIALLFGVLYAFTEFCRRRGFARPLVRAGLIAYAAGVIAMMFAAIVSGFVMAHFAQLGLHATDAELRTTAQLLNLCGVLNQAFANVGAVAMSVAIMLWSLDLLRGAGAVRLVGVLGLVVGLLPAAGLLLGLLHLNVQGMMQVVLLQSLWNIGVGVLLARGAL
jgi:hypothetical protein